MTYAYAKWTAPSGEVHKGYCAINVAMTTLDKTADTLNVYLNDADGDTKLRLSDEEIDLSTFSNIVVTDVTEKDAPRTLTIKRTGTVFELAKSELVYGERTMTFLCDEKVRVKLRVDVFTKMIHNADELVNWVSYLPKTNEVAASADGNLWGKASGYGYWAYDGYVGLATNIDLTGKTVTTKLHTQDGKYGFQGVFNGRGYTIIGGTYGEGGLFGTIGNKGVLKNVSIIDATYHTRNWHKTGSQDAFEKAKAAGTQCKHAGGTSECACSDDYTLHSAVVANCVTGTVENVVIKAQGLSSDGSWSYGFVFGGTLDNAKLKNVVVYGLKGETWYNGGQALTLKVKNVLYADNVYIFSKGGDAATATTDGVTVDIGGKTFNGVTIYHYDTKLTDKVNAADKLTLGETFAAQFTEKFWVLKNDTVEFESYATSNVSVDYELYSSLDAEDKPVANTQALTFEVDGFDGEIGYKVVGKNVEGTATATDGVISLERSVFNTLSGGEYDLQLFSTDKWLTVRLNLWSAYIDNAEELLKWQNYMVVTDYVAANEHEIGLAENRLPYWNYHGAVALTADIDLTGKTVETLLQANDANVGFYGVFDGKGYTIKGGTYGKGGLFGSISKEGVFRNTAIVGATYKMRTWTNSNDVFDSVVSNYTAGTIENVLIQATGLATNGTLWNMGNVFGGKIHGATLKNVHLYNVKFNGVSWYNGNSILTYSWHGSSAQGVYVYSLVGDAPANNVTADNLYIDINKKFNAVNGITVAANPSDNQFPLPIAVEYELYSGINAAQVRVENTQGINVEMPGLTGNVTIASGEKTVTTTAVNGKVNVPAAFMMQLGLGEHVITISSATTTYVIQSGVYTAILDTPQDIQNIEFYCDKTNVTNYGDHPLYSYGEGTYFVLGKNIDMGSLEIQTDIQVGETSYQATKENLKYGFQGIFDGRGYKITGGIYANGGVFGAVSKDGVIRNVAFENVTVKRVTWVEGVVAPATIANYFAGTLENVLISANCADVSGGCAHAAAVAYMMEDATIKNTVVYYKNRWYLPMALYVMGETTTENVYVFSNYGAATDLSYLAENPAYASKIGLTDLVKDDPATKDVNENEAETARLQAIFKKGIVNYFYESKVGDTVQVGDNKENTKTVTVTGLNETYFNVVEGEQVTFKNK